MRRSRRRSHSYRDRRIQLDEVRPAELRRISGSENQSANSGPSVATATRSRSRSPVSRRPRDKPISDAVHEPLPRASGATSTCPALGTVARAESSSSSRRTAATSRSGRSSRRDAALIFSAMRNGLFFALRQIPTRSSSVGLHTKREDFSGSAASMSAVSLRDRASSVSSRLRSSSLTSSAIGHWSSS